MRSGWVAASVRARGLARRRLGSDIVDAVARCRSLNAALALLSEGPYSREIRLDMDLRDAERAVFSVLLWHMRVLAGWGPPMSAGGMRAFSGGFEIANVAGHLARLEGGCPPDPYELGSLADVWPVVASTGSPSEVRAALVSSAWGDPGGDDPATIVLAMRLAWARRVSGAVPAAAQWAIAAAALVAARLLGAGALGSLGPSARRDATRLLGPRWDEATSIPDLRLRLAPSAARVLEGIDAPEELWRAEKGWWETLQVDSARLAGGAVTASGSWVGVVGLLAVDAWRSRAALELAARGGTSGGEVSDALA